MYDAGMLSLSLSLSLALSLVMNILLFCTLAWCWYTSSLSLSLSFSFSLSLSSTCIMEKYHTYIHVCVYSKEVHCTANTYTHTHVCIMEIYLFAHMHFSNIPHTCIIHSGQENVWRGHFGATQQGNVCRSLVLFYEHQICYAVSESNSWSRNVCHDMRSQRSLQQHLACLARDDAISCEMCTIILSSSRVKSSCT